MRIYGRLLGSPVRCSIQPQEKSAFLMLVTAQQLDEPGHTIKVTAAAEVVASQHTRCLENDQSFISPLICRLYCWSSLACSLSPIQLVSG